MSNETREREAISKIANDYKKMNKHKITQKEAEERVRRAILKEQRSNGK